MPWNPEVYNEFKEKRYEPFYDMLSHMDARPGMRILDLGCGTGELTKVIADRFPASSVLGVDDSPEMLSKAPAQPNLSFVQRSVESQLLRDEKWDAIVANASLQWVYDHEVLFPKLISRLDNGGQLAVQMPSQKENVLNLLLQELVHENPYYQVLKDHIHHSPVLSLDAYTQLLYAHRPKEVLVCQKVYPIVTDKVDTLYNFISGSALVPYMERLDEAMRPVFATAFKERIARHFQTVPMVYAFKRLIIVGKF